MTTGEKAGGWSHALVEPVREYDGWEMQRPAYAAHTIFVSIRITWNTFQFDEAVKTVCVIRCGDEVKDVRSKRSWNRILFRLCITLPKPKTFKPKHIFVFSFSTGHSSRLWNWAFNYHCFSRRTSLRKTGQTGNSSPSSWESLSVLVKPLRIGRAGDTWNFTTL